MATTTTVLSAQRPDGQVLATSQPRQDRARVNAGVLRHEPRAFQRDAGVHPVKVHQPRWLLVGRSSHRAVAFALDPLADEAARRATLEVSDELGVVSDDVMHFRPHSAAVPYPRAACRHAREAGRQAAAPSAALRSWKNLVS